MPTSVSGHHVLAVLNLTILQVIDPIISGLSNPWVFAVIVFVGIALPAVWSRKPERRQAAAEVLDRILRFLRPRV